MWDFLWMCTNYAGIAEIQKCRIVQKLCVEIIKENKADIIFFDKNILNSECKHYNIIRGVLLCRLLTEFKPLECAFHVVVWFVDLVH